MSRTGRRWLLVAFTALLAVSAIVLTFLALDHVGTRPSGSDTAPVPTFAQSPEPLPSPSPSGTSTPTVLHERSLERFLTTSAGVLWRGTAGQCGSSEPLLERSTDEGESWADVTPRYLEIGQLIALTPFADGQAEIIALMGADCEVHALRTFTQGQFWESYPEVLAASQYVAPARPESIERSESAVAAPCADARGMRQTDVGLAAICDRTAYVLDQDAEWLALPPEDVSALTFDGDEILIAHASEQCSGTSLTRYTSAGDAAPEEPECIDGLEPNLPAAIASSGGEVLIWSGDAMMLSP